MVTLVHVNEVNKISNMIEEIQEVVLNILTILDDSYGEARAINDMGGYVVIIEEKEELNKFNEFSLNFKEDVTCEYVDKIVTNNGQTYLNAMVLLSD